MIRRVGQRETMCASNKTQEALPVQRGDHFLNMALHLDIPPLGRDPALCIDDKRTPDQTLDGFTEDLFLVDHPVLFADHTTGIAQKREGEGEFIPEFLMRGDAVPADAEDGGFDVMKRFDFITEIAGFLRSPRRVVFGIKEENHRPPAIIVERNSLLFVRFQGE